MEESDKGTALKKAYAEMILNTAKESAARVMVSDKKTARLHHDLCGTKDEALRLLVRLKQMIGAQTIESEITSSNKQRQIDLLEAQLQEAEDIITDLRSEVRWVRDKLEKARKAHNVVVNKERETISNQKIADLEVVVGSVYPNQDRSECVSFLNQKSSLLDDECGGKETISAAEAIASLHPDQEDADTSGSLLNQSSLFDDECGGNDEKQFHGLSVETSKACESDANIRSKKLELSRNGSTQRIHALERKSSHSANGEERRTTEKDRDENLSSVSTRSLVLALRATNAEVIPIKPSNSLGIKKSRKSRRSRKTRWSKRKATQVRSQSPLIKPCQSHSDIPCSKNGEDSMDTHLSVENEEVDALNSCKGLDETKIKPLRRLDHGLTSVKCNVYPTSGSTNATVFSVNATNRSTDDDLKSRMVKCEGGEDSVVPTTKMGPELVDPCSELKANAVVSDQISESLRADKNRLVKYTYQRKRKKGSLNSNDVNNYPPRKRKVEEKNPIESS
ncbi:PREDICTED: uncharacterized protein LOC104710687 [Camelina sativa]|uniref:Uncharacterized protein LOC104710687 n=1 Tax=Camelina sativa TaxID=90675 RepID=A0ABM0TFF2_CAMSA|nr:PREDICTED: uncharacterized protein LOC104710687 [Camelina sativa]XP_010425624.1 PREDICTED: uncharacterized protein LOC104710687 [Camelina sativa]